MPQLNHGALSYKDALTELMSSLEAMNFSEASSPLSSKSPNVPWVDVNSFNNEDQQQIIFSPSTPNPCGSANFFSGHCFSKNFSDENKNEDNNNKVNDNGWSCSDPDLGWVNELLM